MPGSNDYRQKQVRLLLFVLAGAGVLAMAAISMNAFTWFRLEVNIRNLWSTSQLAVDWNVAMSLVKDIEVGQRGYLLTGDPEYLEPFEAAITTLPGQWDSLMDRKPQDQEFSLRVADARRLATEVIESAQETIIVRKLSPEDESVAMETIQRGRVAMDELREHLNIELDALNQAIFATAAQLRTDLQTGLLSGIATGISALGLGGTAFVLIRRILREMRRTDRYALERVRAEKAGQEKSSFLAMMSHEVRTPLNAILGFSDLIHSQAKSPQTKQYASSIINSGRALLQLLNDILDISKLDSGLATLQLAPVSLKSLSSFVTGLFQETAAKKQITIETWLAPDLPESFLLDEVRLRQVVINLVGNAVKYSESGTVRMQMQGTPSPDDLAIWDLTFAVSDNGPGISPKAQETIFRPFVRSESDSRPTTEGTGLGLAIVQRFVTFMQGTVELTSEPGKGSTFTIKLPRVAVSNRLPVTAVIENQPVDFDTLKPAKLLAVDDNETNLDLVQSIFFPTQHEVFLAKSGQEALEVIESVEPDLVLMDIRMPDMDGITALKTIRADPRFRMLPVVAVTASSRIEDDIPDRSGFDGCVRKPFSRQELFEQMAQFLPARPAEPPPEPADPSASQNWIPLRDRLNDWKTSRWPALKDSMALSEVTAFAEDVTKAAQAVQCPTVTTYGEKLTAATKVFAFGEMEQLVLQFPALIEELSRQIEP